MGYRERSDPRCRPLACVGLHLAGWQRTEPNRGARCSMCALQQSQAKPFRSRTPASHVRPHRRRPRNHPADRLADPQRLHRFHQDDDEPRRRRDRRRARRPPRRRLRLQLQRPLRPGRPDPRAVRAAHPRGRARQPARRSRRQPRSRPRLGRDDGEREAGRPRRALGRGRHARHGGLGRGREDRRQAAVPPARRAPRPRGRSARLRLCRRRLLLSRQGPRGAARRRCARYLDRGYTRREDEDRRRRRSTRTAPASRRCWPRSAPRAARRRRQRPFRSRDRDRLRQDAARLSAVLVRGGRRPARLRAAGGAGGVLSGADGDRARTCSATRMRATCCATAACARTATGCSSTAR